MPSDDGARGRRPERGLSLLLTADWVLPVSSAPLQGGGVLVEGERVTSVGPAAELAVLDPAAERHDFPGCTITPTIAGRLVFSVSLTTKLKLSCPSNPSAGV